MKMPFTRAVGRCPAFARVPYRRSEIGICIPADRIEFTLYNLDQPKSQLAQNFSQAYHDCDLKSEIEGGNKSVGSMPVDRLFTMFRKADANVETVTTTMGAE